MTTEPMDSAQGGAQQQVDGGSVQPQANAEPTAVTFTAEQQAHLERANSVIAALVESRTKGLPEAMLKALEGRDLYDQLQLADAYWSSQPAAGQRLATTQPTPAPQAPGQTDFVKQAIDRQNKRATAQDPYAEMMKR